MAEFKSVLVRVTSSEPLNGKHMVYMNGMTWLHCLRRLYSVTCLANCDHFTGKRAKKRPGNFESTDMILNLGYMEA